MINEGLIYDYLYCKYKAFLKSKDEIGLTHHLEKFEENEINKRESVVLSTLCDSEHIADVEGNVFSKKIIENHSVIKNAVFNHNSFQLKLNVFKKTLGDDKYSYSLLFFVPVRKIDKAIKLYISICQRVSSYCFNKLSSESIVYYNGSETSVKINSEA